MTTLKYQFPPGHSTGIRWFLFQTELALGAAGFPLGPKVLLPPPIPDCDLETSLSFEAEALALPDAGVEEADPAIESGLEIEDVAPLAARNVLLTETDLKLVGFLTAEALRKWLLSSSLDFEASVSEPPLTLTSADCTSSSTRSVACLFSISLCVPFTGGLSEVALWRSESM